MRHSLTLQIGPATFRIGSAWRQPVEELTRLYAGYPDRHDAIADFTVRLQPAGPLRRWVRPSIFITGDHGLADAAPMSLAHGLLAAEMGMNLQMALGWRRHLLLHASSVEKDGRALNARVEGQFITNNVELIIQSAIEGVGIAFVPQDHVADHVAAGRLERVLDDWCPPFPGYHLYYPSRRQPKTAFALLIEALRYRGA